MATVISPKKSAVGKKAVSHKELDAKRGSSVKPANSGSAELVQDPTAESTLVSEQRQALAERRKSLDDRRARSSDKTVVEIAPATQTKVRANPIGADFNWPVFLWIATLHVGALAAPFYFSWQAAILVVVLHWLTGGVGICLGYHRQLTHTSFTTYPWVRYFLGAMGSLAGEGSPIDWVANHRKHHALSDQEGDPHSPQDGSWWSHITWIFFMKTKDAHREHVMKWAPDLAKDRGMQVVSSLFLPLQFTLAVILGCIGYAVGGSYMATSFVVYGIFVRLVAVMHSTWFVNSASHMWGYRNYETTDDSRNNWWVALITYGEGWHNNHHADPRSARHGHKWWEFDTTFLTIRLFEKLGLATDVVGPSPHVMAKGNMVTRGGANTPDD